MESVQQYAGRLGRERDLAKAGHHLASAIGKYYMESPGTVQIYPKSLSDVLLDPRFLAEKRHIEYLPPDPITLKVEWGVVRNQVGDVIGVHSLSQEEPTWVGRWFTPSGSSNEKYSDWKFVFSGKH